MDTIIINFKNDTTISYNNVNKAIVSGEHLIVTEKKIESVKDETFAFLINTVHDLGEINDYTIKIKTKKYTEYDKE